MMLMAIILISNNGYNNLFAQVSITAPSRTVTACSAFPTNSETLSNIVITESAAGDISGSGTLILSAPTNFEFTSAGNASASGTEITGLSVILTNANAITLTFSVGGTIELNAITLAGIQIIGITGATSASAVTRTGGTSLINGNVNGTVHASLTSVLNSVTGGTIASAQTICAGADPAAFTETVAATGSGTLMYQWQQSTDGYSATLAVTSTYDIPSGLTATTTYRRVTTSTLGGVACTANSNLITVMVNPTPVATATPSSQTICSGDATSIVVSSNTPGTTFSWTVVQTGVSGASFGSGATISQTLTTTGSVGGTAVYTITPVAGGCVGSPISLTVFVNPQPLLSSILSPPAICSGAVFSYIPTSNVTGATFSWTRAAVAGISNPAGSGGGNPNEVLTNTTSNPVNVIYMYTVSANGCNGGSPTSITVTVNPANDASFAYTSATYCQTGTNPTPAINSQNGVFSASPAGLSIDSSTGLIDLISSSLGTYTVTYITNGICNDTSSVTITITASPSANFSYSDTSYCQNANNPSPIYGSGASAGTFSSSPAGLVFVHVNTGEINIPLSAAGTYTVTNTIQAGGGCIAISATDIVTINASDNASFTYTSTTYCLSGSNPTPTITGSLGGGFSASPSGLSIDSLTGTIDIITSSLGTYNVKYATNGFCPDSGSVMITITISPSANFSYSDTAYCQNANNPSPIYGTGASAGTFSATPLGLVVSGNTGVIFLAGSAPGTYTVTNTIPAGGGCAAVNATTTIHIINNCGISGYIFKDNNANCLKDIGDQTVSYIPVKLYDNNNNNNNFVGITYSNYGGFYYFPKPLGTYTVKIDTANTPYNVLCVYPGIDSTVILTGGNSSSSNVNFEIACKLGFDIGVQSIWAQGWVFPGQQHKLYVWAGNMSQWYNQFNCFSGISGQVQVTVAGPVTYNGPALGALTPSVSGNVFTYTIADFGTINYWSDFRLLFTTNTYAQAGDQICVNVVVTPTNGDNNISNNTKQFCYIVGNSYDPNMKEVYPVDVAPAYQDWFTYTVHFQNTGNAPAFNIRLADTLDTNLDFETFELINFSDSIEVSLDNNNLTFNFPNIMLPDSTSDPEGSKGFVQYRVKPKANLPAGTQILNTAYIYFDYNAPIVTNTTINEFLEPASISEIKSSGTLSVYPNPGNGKFKIQMDNGQLSIDNYQLSIYNVLGEKIFQSEIKNLKTEIDISHQPNGIYIIRVNDGIQSLNQRLIKQ